MIFARLPAPLAGLVVLSSLTLSACRPARPPRTPERNQTPARAKQEGSAPTKPQPKAKKHKQEVQDYTLFRGARIMTANGDVFDKGELLIGDDRILAVGPKVDVPEGTLVVDLSGKTITPGIIDTHSHLGVYASPGLRAHSDGNEAVSPVTAYVRAIDGYWPQDPQIDSARAGGVTTIQVLPGSANLIGGRTAILRLRPGVRSAEDARFEGAPDGLKMACGENPKRVHGKRGGPSTRMGNVAGYRRAFQSAKEYKRGWDKYEKEYRKWKKDDPGEKASEKKRSKHAEAKPAAPTYDPGLATLAEVLEGKILVHNHCYRADEMMIMLGIAKEFGFKIRSFHHAVEAYKIADALALADTSASMWADWWGFKAEAYDMVLENAAMVSRAGAIAVIHSDSPTDIQHLNQEAAKAMYAGRAAGIEISENEALRWITANAAWTLGIEKMTGDLSPGKLADLVVWSGNPFSVYTRAEEVYMAGEKVYDRNDSNFQPQSDFRLGLTPAP